MRDQRRVDPGQFLDREKPLYWSPTAILVDKEHEIGNPGGGDWYAVVDEIEEGIARLEIAMWPEVDSGGHLRFTDIFEESYPIDALQVCLNQQRGELGQQFPDRPIRRGDTFMIRSSERPGETTIGLEFGGSIYDVSRAAREQAKIAMLGAVARGLRQEEIEARRREVPDPNRFRRSRDRGLNPAARHLGDDAGEPEN